MKITVARRASPLWLQAVELAREIYATNFGADIMPDPDAFIVAHESYAVAQVHSADHDPSAGEAPSVPATSQTLPSQSSEGAGGAARAGSRPAASVEPAGAGPSACAGLTFAADAPLFSERYLGASLEDEIARVLGTVTDRNRIVEVGSLSTRQRFLGRELIRATPIIAWCLGMEYILCTATSTLLKSLRRLEIEFVPFCPADPNFLSAADRDRWGTYYDDDPQVGVIPLNSLHRLFAKSTGRYLFADTELTLTTEEVIGHAGR